MSSFNSKLWLEDTGDGEHWIVCADFEYDSDLLHGIVVLPIRSETDLATMPKIIRPIWPKSGKHNRADVLHDGGYRGLLRTVHGEPIHLIKPLCDLLFLEALELCGIGKVKRTLMYRFVRRYAQKALGQRP